MSELMNAIGRREDCRWRLLTGVSVLSLLTVVGIADNVKAEEVERPTVWIEFGGQLERMNAIHDTSTADFMSNPQPLPPTPFSPVPASIPSVFPGVPVDLPNTFDRMHPLQVQKEPRYSFGGEANVFFEPKGSDWILSASVRYGRSNGSKTNEQQTQRPSYVRYPTKYPLEYRLPEVVRVSNGSAKYNESHAVLDFQVGKDVGLGLFGRDSKSVFSLGVRFAQFTARSDVRANAVPDVLISAFDVSYPGLGAKYLFNTRFPSYTFNAQSRRSSHGVGPSVSWAGSTPFLGNPDGAQLVFDWGINAALLFGRQKASLDHETVAKSRFVSALIGHFYSASRYKHTGSASRSRSITIPNLGGSLGLSVKFPNAKISFGYRADFFFGAMDTGIDTHHDQTVGFHGPFATISIGLGG